MLTLGLQYVGVLWLVTWSLWSGFKALGTRYEIHLMYVHCSILTLRCSLKLNPWLCALSLPCVSQWERDTCANMLTTDTEDSFRPITFFLFRIMEVSQESQSIVFESSSQDLSNSGILFQARRSSCESMGTGSQAEGKQRSAQGTGLQSNSGLHLIKARCNS